MLGLFDTPTIRFALHRRLDREPGVSIVDIKFERYAAGEEYWAELPLLDQYGNGLAPGVLAVAEKPFLRCGVHLLVGQLIQLRSIFDLPEAWEIGHLRNEIDEIAEGAKRARREYFTHGLGRTVIEKRVGGTGLRGGWRAYG